VALKPEGFGKPTRPRGPWGTHLAGCGRRPAVGSATRGFELGDAARSRQAALPQALGGRARSPQRSAASPPPSRLRVCKRRHQPVRPARGLAGPGCAPAGDGADPAAPCRWLAATDRWPCHPLAGLHRATQVAPGGAASGPAFASPPPVRAACSSSSSRNCSKMSASFRPVPVR